MRPFHPGPRALAFACARAPLLAGLPLLLITPAGDRPWAALGIAWLWVAGISHELGHLLAARLRGQVAEVGRRGWSPVVRVPGESSWWVAAAGFVASLLPSVGAWQVLAHPWGLSGGLLGLLWAAAGAVGDLKLVLNPPKPVPEPEKPPIFDVKP